MQSDIIWTICLIAAIVVGSLIINRSDDPITSSFLMVCNWLIGLVSIALVWIF